MKNGNMPANPIRGANNTIFTQDDAGAIEGCGLLIGLTKREAFAMAAMQGMSSHPDFYGQSNDFAKNIAKDSVNFADALLAELDK